MPRDISERLRQLINMRQSADNQFAMPSEPEADFSAPAFPDIEALGSAPDPDYTNPFTGAPAYNSSPKKGPAPPLRVGQFYGRG